VTDHFCICVRVRDVAWAKHDPAFHAIDIFYLFGTAADLRDEEDPHTKLAFDYMTYWWVLGLADLECYLPPRLHWTGPYVSGPG
jgi:hypothetical protein